MITYRDGVPADAGMMTEVANGTFVETFAPLYSSANLTKFLATRTPFVHAQELADPAFAVRFAEAGGTVIGFAKLGPPALPFPPTGRPAIELRQLYVYRPHHGVGIAQTLMQWAIDTARQRGALELYLSVFTANARARAFYARYGFVEVGPYFYMVGDQADEDIILRLDL